MKFAPLLRVLCALGVMPLHAVEPPKPPIVNDTALKIELLVTTPDVEACTTVCGAPDGSFYVGNDPRDGRLSNKEPVNTITRFSSMGADKKRTVFADKIYSPAGSAWHDGYLYVLHDPLLTRFKDTDGDGSADVREDLVTNLGIPPNEGLNDHVVSGFTLGMDGFFYISVGDRGIFQAKSARDGSTITMQGGGIARCRTDGTQLEVFSTGTRNHLQVNLDAEDNAFTRDNTDDGNGWWTRLTHHIEGGYYGYPYDYRKAPNYGVVQPSQQTLDAIKQHGGVAVPLPAGEVRRQKSEASDPGAGASLTSDHWPLTSSASFLPAMADFGGGSPTGGLCYLSDGLPEQYRGKHFFSEWGKAGVFVTEVARDGATFKLVSDTKLIEPEKGGDFRPMQLSVAADGSLLIADWGYGGWKSPRAAGAIWRLSWPEAKIAPRLKDESKASGEVLITALAHPDRDQRLRAQWELIRRIDKDLSAPFAIQAGELAMTMRASAITRAHALWTTKLAIELRPDMPDAKEVREIFISGPEGERLLPPSTAFPAGRTHLPRDIPEKLGIAYIRLQRGLLEDSLPSVRVQAARAFAGDLSGIFARDFYCCFPNTPRAQTLLDDPDPAVRLQGAISYGNEAELSSLVQLIERLSDSDPFVGFAAMNALKQFDQDRERISLALTTDPEASIIGAPTKITPQIREGVWRVFGSVFEPQVVKIVGERSRDRDAGSRTRAVTALGRIAYQPQPYDGHWWGTQPVKSRPPLNSVPWAGTPPALAALTAALGDADTGVRLAAAKAFTTFTLGGTRSRASQTSAGGGGGDQGLAGASPSGTAAAAALRARLTAESDAAIRRQLIESLGVQRDPQAMDVFRQIALDEKADAEFRDTAIGAVVTIGGDAAKETIAKLAGADLSPRAMLRVIEAAGSLKVTMAAPALLGRFKAEDAATRAAAVKSFATVAGPLMKPGGPLAQPGATGLIAMLADKDGKVQAAAIEALGNLREKSALPALIALAEKRKSMKETMGALANMPDESAIPVLVETLRDKNTSVRRNAIKALKTMRDKAWPQVEALLATGRVPEELVPEIRNAFASGALVRWKMVGVFENVWDAVHQPEKDVLAAAEIVGQAPRLPSAPPAPAAGGAPALQFLAQKYHNAEGKDVGWIDVTADATEGRVDLGQVFKTSAMVCAYAFTEIDAPEAADAKLFTSADDEIAAWLNGRQVLNVAGNHGYEPDKNETALALRAGKNQLFMKIGNKGGTWVFHARVPGFDNGKFIKSKETPADEKQRHFALAARPDGTYVNKGDAAKGEKLFFDPAAGMGAICATCHAVKGKGGQIGPDLGTVAANYKRPDLITSLHEPGKTIALGFEQVMLETKAGEVFAGALRQETADALTLIGADGQPHAVKKTDVKTQTHVPVSLMPAGLTLGLKPQEFADLLAYLETLTGK